MGVQTDRGGAQAGAVSRTRREGGRAEILDAAAKFIATSGFHGMSMRDLSRATGKGLASLYNYFDSKDELLFAMQSGSFQQLIASAEGALETITDPSDKLYAFIATHVRYVAEHPDIMRVLVQEASTLSPAHRRQVRSLKIRYFHLAESIVEEVLAAKSGGEPRRDPIDVERTTYSIFGMLNWVYGWYQPSRHGTAFDVARSIHRLALSGLSARSRERLDLHQLERRISLEPMPSLSRVCADEGHR